MGNYYRSFPFFISEEEFENRNAAIRWTVAGDSPQREIIFPE